MFAKKRKFRYWKMFTFAKKSNLVSSYCIQRILVACMKGNNLSEFIFSFSYFLFSQAWFSSQAQFILRRLDPRIPTSSPFLTVSGGRWSQWPPLDTATWRMALCFKTSLLLFSLKPYTQRSFSSSTRKIVSRFQTYWSIQLHPEISCHLINGIWSKYADVAKNVGQQNVCMRVQMSKRCGVCVSEFGHIKCSAKYLNNFYLSFNRPFFQIYANILDNL